MAIPAENQNTKPKTLLTALNQLLVLSIIFLGFLGLVLIAYAIIAHYSQSRWQVLDNVALYVAVVATIIGTMLTAVSIYLPENRRKPEAFSIYISAPLVILGCIVVLGYAIFNSFALPDHLLNGIAILSISGGLFRLISR